MFQSTRPRGERLALGMACPDGRCGFQSTRPRGERPADMLHSRELRKFQSTRPRGERRRMKSSTAFGSRVSIHAPARGATRRAISRRSPIAGFNPRARAGSDLPPFCPMQRSRSFNPRARAGSDMHFMCLRWYELEFQSTRPRGERQGRGKIVPRQVRVSIHAPARGATHDHPARRHLIDVSIHAPARGATRTRIPARPGPRCFNPRARAGSDDPRWTSPGGEAGFNPRARAGSDNSPHGLGFFAGSFQSTRPRGERQPTARVHLSP